MAAQYRYSKDSFFRSLITAIGLTLIVSFLVWLFARLFGLRHADVITAVSGTIFFGFCSAATIWRYFNQSVVFAVRPDGLFDARHSTQAVPWDHIKDMRLARAENDFQLGVYLWPDASKRKTGAGVEPDFTIDLEPLDAPVDQIIERVLAYKTIVLEER